MYTLHHNEIHITYKQKGHHKNTNVYSVVSDYHNLVATLLQFDIDNAVLQADISNYSNSNYSLQL